MKKWTGRLVVVCFSFLALSAFAQSGTVTVEVSGVNAAGGLMSIGLFSSENGFPDKGAEYKGKDVDVTGETVSLNFVNVPFGTYAVAVFHDVNSNMKLDTNFLGIPTEGYGFSNNAFGALGLPPGFEKAAFQVEGDMALNIKVEY